MAKLNKTLLQKQIATDDHVATLYDAGLATSGRDYSLFEALLKGLERIENICSKADARHMVDNEITEAMYLARDLGAQVHMRIGSAQIQDIPDMNLEPVAEEPDRVSVTTIECADAMGVWVEIGDREPIKKGRVGTAQLHRRHGMRISTGCSHIIHAVKAGDDR